MNSHVQDYINALALSVMVGKLMGGALGMPLVGPTHRYAGVTPHLTHRPSPAPHPTARARRPYVVHTRVILWNIVSHRLL